MERSAREFCFKKYLNKYIFDISSRSRFSILYRSTKIDIIFTIYKVQIKTKIPYLILILTALINVFFCKTVDKWNLYFILSATSPYRFISPKFLFLFPLIYYLNFLNQRNASSMTVIYVCTLIKRCKKFSHIFLFISKAKCALYNLRFVLFILQILLYQRHWKKHI